MFSGIIQSKGRVQHATLLPQVGTMILCLESSILDAELGESIAVNGVCLTVAEMDSKGVLQFALSQETLKCTALGELAVGAEVNLERSLPNGARNSGHWVQGHVDGVGEIKSMSSQSESINTQSCYTLQVGIPREFSRYCIQKGSIALNGVSLTINAIQENLEETLLSFTLVPHTVMNTSFHQLSAGRKINFELDCIAKYVEKLCHPYQKS
jgi:riboflavin synthase